MEKNLLVLGGTGFIGNHLVNYGIKNDWEITSLSLHRPSLIRYVKGVKYNYVDITNKSKIKNYLNKNNFNYVVNLTGYIDHCLFSHGGRKVIDSHFTGLLNIIEFLNRDYLKMFLHIGSSDEYGNNPSPQNENYRESPISPYSLSKVSITHFLQMINKTENFPSAILRPFITYGPTQDSERFLPQLIIGCMNNNIIPVSEGKQLRDFCYISDTIEAIYMALLSNKIFGNILNVGSGKPV